MLENYDDAVYHMQALMEKSYSISHEYKNFIEECIKRDAALHSKWEEPGKKALAVLCAEAV